MSVRSFFDTNVFVYADDDAEPVKQRRAIELYEQHRHDRTGVVSTQVLQEYFATVTRKLGKDAGEARNKLQLIAQFDVGVPDVADIFAAIDLHRLHTISFWDALIIRVAQQTGCRVLYSEDLQNKREIEGLKVVNPFQ